MKLDDRFESLTRTRPPDLWPDIETRQPRSPVDLGPSPLRRAGIALLALAVAAASFTFAIRAFRTGGGPAPTPATQLPAETDGLIAYAGGTGAGPQIFTMQPDGTHRTALTSVVSATPEHPYPAWEPAWSPDGSHLAFRGFYGQGERSDLFVMQADGTQLHQLTTDLAANPAWSPDGMQIAFDNWRGISVIGSNGTHLYQVTPESQGEAEDPTWSPDGTLIAYDGFPGRLSQIFTIGVDGSGEQHLTDIPDGAADPSWSPDGTHIAFIGDLLGTPDVFVMNADGTGVKQITNCDPPDCRNDRAPTWAPDGSVILFSRDLDLYTVKPDGSDLTAITSDHAGYDGPSWQPLRTASTFASPSGAPVAASVTATIDVGHAGSLAYGEGSVWVAVSNNDGSYAGHILRIDPETSKVIADISVDTVPGWEVGGGLAVGDGSVWIAGSMNGEGTLDSGGGGSDALILRIDAATNQVVDRIPLGGLHGADVAVDGSGVWVMLWATGGTMEVDRIDPATDRVVATIPLNSTYGHFIFATSGYIVAATNATHRDTVGGTILNVIDPATNAVVASTPLGEYGWPAASSDSIYAATVRSVVRIDPATGQVVKTYFGVAGTGDALTVGEGGVWFFSPEDRSAVHRLNTDNGEVDTSTDLPNNLTPIAMTTSPGAVWVLEYEGKLVKVSLT